MQKNQNGGNSSLEIDASILAKCDIDEFLYKDDLDHRRLFLCDDIDAVSVFDIVRQIVKYNESDKGIPVEKRKPIVLYICSPGGSISDGYEIIDVIKASKTPIYTVNLGYCYSMAFMIYIAGHKRYAMANSKFLIHDGSFGTYDSGCKAQDQVKFYNKVVDRMEKFIAESTAISSKEYKQKIRVEWYMFADEAKEKKIVDYIIGEDCDLDILFN